MLASGGTLEIFTFITLLGEFRRQNQLP